MIWVFPGKFLALLIHITLDHLIEFLVLSSVYEFSWIYFSMYWGSFVCTKDVKMNLIKALVS